MEAFLKMIAGVVERDGWSFGINTFLIAFIVWLLYCCRADSKHQNALKREDDAKTIQALEALRHGVMRNTETLIALKEIVRGRN